MPASRSTEHAQAPKPRWSLARVVLLLMGLALVAVFVGRVGAQQILTRIAGAGPKALWLLIPYGLGTAIGGLPWGALLPARRPSTLALVQSRFAASSANSLLPFFGMAGEPSRLLWLAPSARAAGVAAIMVDRVLYNSANGILLILGALGARLSTSLPGSLVFGALVIGILTLAVTAGALWLVARIGVGQRAQALLRRLLGQSYGDAEFGQRVDSRLLEIVRGPRRVLLLGAATHLVGRIVIALEVYVGLWSLGAHASVGQALVLAVVVPIALSFFFSSVPGQLGVQEATQTLVAAALQLSPAVALSLVLLQRFRQLVFALMLPPLLAAAAPSSADETSPTLGHG